MRLIYPAPPAIRSPLHWRLHGRIMFGTAQIGRDPRAESMTPIIRSRANSWASPINSNEPHEVRIWCRLFGCSETELRGAIAKVGTSSDKVLAELLRKDEPIHLVR